jgi:uncharacterized protein with PQ loop repeat
MVAATVFTISSIFQIVRMCRTGSARDVSFWYMTLMTLGIIATWGIVMIDQNGFYIRVERTLGVASSLVVWSAMLHFKLKDRNKRRHDNAIFASVADQLRETQRKVAHLERENGAFKTKDMQQRRTLAALHERAAERNAYVETLLEVLHNHGITITPPIHFVKGDAPNANAS